MDTRIAPGFLVAAPQLRDPNFERAVVLMVEHDDEEGSLGLVVNREAGVDLFAVLAELRVKLCAEVDLASHPPVLSGGPVTPERGWVIHSPDWSGEGTRPVTDDLSVTASPDVLQAIAAGNGPRRYLFCLGYAGWGPHQLVGEIKDGAWITVPFAAELVFDVPLAGRWSAALGRLGIDPAQLSPFTGDA